MDELEIKIKLLEEMKADLEEQHKNLVEGFNGLQNLNLFSRDSDQALLDGMYSKIVAINHINKFLYPLYWKREGKK